MNTEATELLFYPYVSHERIELIESRHANTYRHLLRLLTPHPHIYDYIRFHNALPNSAYQVFTLDDLDLDIFPVVAVLPTGQVVQKSFLIYTYSSSKYSKGWIKGLTKEQCIDACSSIEFIDLMGNNKGSDFIVNNLDISENKH